MNSSLFRSQAAHGKAAFVAHQPRVPGHDARRRSRDGRPIIPPSHLGKAALHRVNLIHLYASIVVVHKVGTLAIFVHGNLLLGFLFFCSR